MPTAAQTLTPGDTACVDRVERALAEFLLRRENEPELTASAFVVGVPTHDRSAFAREAHALVALDATFAAAQPSRLAGYRLLSLLGEGGTARVFSAEHETSGRRVAVKVLHRHLSQNPRSRARLCREARIAQTLSHPGIVPVIECGEAEGQVFLVMEHLHGTSLHRLLDAKSAVAGCAEQAQAEAFLSDHRQLALAFAAVADALHAAHAQGVIHRDLKPSNLMVQPDGTVIVLDFGLCSSPDAQLTRSTDFLGTPVYMSPEQAGGRHEDMGPHSDVYSLGAVLYECVTGQPTVAPGSLPRVLDAVRGGRVPYAHRRACVADPLSRILARCLQKNPAQRYACARDLADDLRAYAAGQLPVAARSHARKRAMHVTLASLVLIVGVLAGARWVAFATADHGADLGAAGVDLPATLPAEVTRNLVELAQQGDEVRFARELQRVLQQEHGAAVSSH